MTTYLISYDLAQPMTNKHAVAGAIMAAGDSWARPLEGTWYVRSTGRAAAIEAQIRELLGDDDGLLVQAVADQAVLTNTALRWFKRRAPLEQDASAEILAFPATKQLDDAVVAVSDDEAAFDYAQAS